MNWQEAWEIHKDAAAEAAHVRWMQTKQAHGFADHPLDERRTIDIYQDRVRCGRCDLAVNKHHSDMIPFDDLAPEIQKYDYETAIIGFKFGFEAGHSSGFEEGWNAHLAAPTEAAR